MACIVTCRKSGVVCTNGNEALLLWKEGDLKSKVLSTPLEIFPTKTSV